MAASVSLDGTAATVPTIRARNSRSSPLAARISSPTRAPKRAEVQLEVLDVRLPRRGEPRRRRHVADRVRPYGVDRRRRGKDQRAREEGGEPSAIAAVTCTDGTVKEPAHDAGGGCLVATVTDPDGNVPGCFTTDECRPPLPRLSIVATPSIGSPTTKGVWVASAPADGAPHLVPLSFDWDSEALLPSIATTNVHSRLNPHPAGSPGPGVARLLKEVPLNWNKWVRQIHRWAGALVIAFTTTVAVSFVALGQEDPALWVLYLPLPPLALQLLTGLYLFVLPYATNWRSGRCTLTRTDPGLLAQE